MPRPGAALSCNWRLAIARHCWSWPNARDAAAARQRLRITAGRPKPPESVVVSVVVPAVTAATAEDEGRPESEARRVIGRRRIVISRGWRVIVIGGRRVVVSRRRRRIVIG